VDLVVPKAAMVVAALVDKATAVAPVLVATAAAAVMEAAVTAIRLAPLDHLLGGKSPVST